MRKHGMWVALFLTVLAWTSLPAESQETKLASPKDISVTVTVERHGPNAPAVLHPDDVIVFQNNQRRQVVRWVQATSKNEGLDLAILLDDSLDPAIGINYPNLKNFIRSLPTSTKVAIAYGIHGDATIVQNFTDNHEQAAAAIRITQGRMNETSSIYMAFTNLVKHWPADGNRRAVLLISDGIDLYWGVTEALPSNNPDLRRAVQEAQRHGVNAYAIYAETAGDVRRNSFLVNTGQSCLSLLAIATGGKAYFQGLQTPIDFESIFKELKGRLDNQYLLTFRAEQGERDSYDRLRLSTEQPGIELVAPSHVFVPGVERTVR